MNPIRRSLLMMAVLGAAFVTGIPTASADAPVNTEILVIHATKCDKKTVDPAITEPPPSIGDYNCLALVQKKVVGLTINQPNATALPNGRTFQLIHTEKVANRFKLRASINSADGNGFTKLADITADPGKQVNVGGWMHQGGRIVVAIKIL
jgi:hypothetical protein